MGFLDDLCRRYETFEKEHAHPTGLFWSKDGCDAMEYSVSGTDEALNVRKGIRPTLNSYMCAAAAAISEFARRNGDKKIAEAYEKKQVELKEKINSYLWRDGFYRAIHYSDGEAPTYSAKASPKELIGYIPWMFEIPKPGREEVFTLLSDENTFYTRYGLTTVEKNSPRFLYEADHECLWNGYIWPFATSQTLTALASVAKKTENGEYTELFYKLLRQYAQSHQRTDSSGKTVSWIDESMSPENGEWYSRKILKELGWQKDIGGYERGKDYNHSTFCDLVLSGLLGIEAEGESLKVEPRVPKSWNYFRVQNLWFRGNFYDIFYDKVGTRYNLGKGLKIIKKQHF